MPLGTEEENLNFYKSIFRSKRRPRWRGAFDHVFSLPTLEPDGNLCSRSSTLGSFNRLKKTERGDQRGTAAGPLVILTPPPSSTSAPTQPAPGDSGSPSELGHRMESQPLSNVQPSPSSLNAPSGSGKWPFISKSQFQNDCHLFIFRIRVFEDVSAEFTQYWSLFKTASWQARLPLNVRSYSQENVFESWLPSSEKTRLSCLRCGISLTPWLCIVFMGVILVKAINVFPAFDLHYMHWYNLFPILKGNFQMVPKPFEVATYLPRKPTLDRPHQPIFQ